MAKATRASLEIPPAQVISATEADNRIPHRPNKYDSIVESIKKLEPGKALVLPFAPEQEPKKVANALTNVLQQRGYKAPKGYRLWRQVGSKNELIIVLRPIKAKADKKGK